MSNRPEICFREPIKPISQEKHSDKSTASNGLSQIKVPPVGKGLNSARIYSAAWPEQILNNFEETKKNCIRKKHGGRS